MTDLLTFLLTRIAEDEERARVETVLRDGDPYYGDPGEANSYERWFTPVRVLADCDAKRRILGEAVAYLVTPADGGWDDVDSRAYHHAEQTLEFLALPYADHTDYREEWRL